MKTINVTWQTIDSACRHIPSQKQYNTIIGIGTGGLIPATIIHKTYHDSVLYNLGIKTRHGDVILQPLVYQAPPTHPKPYGDILVVDDIYDTGNTFKQVEKMLKSIWGDEICENIDYYAVFLSKKSYNDVSQKPPCLYSYLADENTWLNFPWE